MSSRNKIVAATMGAAALGLGFAGYITRANGTEDQAAHPAYSVVSPGARGYRENHQVGHGAAVFGWMDAATMWSRSPKHSGSDEPEIGQCFIPIARDHDAAPVGAVAQDDHGDSGNRGHSGGGSVHAGVDAWSGSGSHYMGGFAGSFGSGGGFASRGNSSGGSSGLSKSSNDKPAQNAPPTASGSNTDQPSGGNPNHPNNGNPNPPGNSNPNPSGSGEPKAGDPPPANNPNPPQNNSNPPNPPQNKPETQNPPIDPPAKPPVNPPAPQERPPEGGPNDAPPPWTEDPPKEVHSVPEPATTGLMAFGIAAAAALRRRRRN